MFILNKKKYFSKVFADLFKINIAGVIETKNTLIRYGAEPLIEKDHLKFTLSAYLFHLFFAECALQQKYYPKYTIHACKVIDALIVEISDRLKLHQDVVYDAYMVIRKLLGDETPTDTIFEDLNPFVCAGYGYLSFTFKEEFRPEQSGFDNGEAEEAVARLFQKTLSKSIESLNSQKSF